MGRARSLAGGPIRYVKMTEYGQSEARIVAFRLISDVPAETCREIADSWFMGETTVETMDARQLADVAVGLMTRPVDGRKKGRRYWGASLGLSRRCSVGLARLKPQALAALPVQE